MSVSRSPMARRLKHLALGVLVALAGAWLTKPMARLGLMAVGRPQPSGPLQVTTTDVAVPLRTPGGGEPASVRARIWYPRNTTTAAPLLLYGPGWGGRLDDNVVRLAELASHGYVIVAYDDIAHDPAVLDASPEDADARTTSFDLGTEASRAHLEAVFDRRVRLAAEKVLALLDVLTSTPALLPSEVRFSQQRIGIFGASFGGAVAAEAAQSDPQKRMRAAINFDGWMYGEVAARTVAVPFLMFNSTRGVSKPDWATSTDPQRRFLELYDRRDRATIKRQLATRHDAIDVTIIGSGHSDFGDDLYNPRRWTQWRPWRENMIAVDRMRTIVDAYVLAFFRQHLEGVPQPLLQSPQSPYSEVKILLGNGTPAMPPKPD